MGVSIKREWATPAVAGTFLLTAVTGGLMFFHLDTGWNKLAHEWLSWLLVAGVVAHLTLNLGALKRYLTMWRGRLLLGGFALVLLLSFLPAGGGGEPPHVRTLGVLADAPLSALAAVARTTPEELLERAARAGITVESDRQSVRELAAGDRRRQVELLARLLDRPVER